MLKHHTRNKAIFLRIRIMLSILSLGVTLTSFSFVTYAWFSHNRTASIHNANVNIDTPFRYTTGVKVDDFPISGANINFVAFFPGTLNSRKLTLTFTNIDTKPIKVRWFFKIPTITEEIPFIDTLGTYGPTNDLYYFGSQLQMSNIAINNDGVIINGGVGQGRYLVTTSSVGLTKGQINSVSSPVNFTDELVIVDDLNVAAGKTAITNIIFTFVDNGLEQNVFQNETMTSERELALFLNPGDAV